MREFLRFELGLFLGPVLVGLMLLYFFRLEYVREVEDARRHAESTVTDLQDRLGEDWWPAELGRVWSRIEGAAGSRREPFLLALGGGRVLAGRIVLPGQGDGEPGPAWTQGDRLPGGIPAAAIADPEVRLRVERGEAPARLAATDGQARGVESLLADPPDLGHLRVTLLSAATKLFVVRRWRADRPGSRELRDTEALLAALARIQTAWRDDAQPPVPGVHRLGGTTVLVSPKDGTLLVELEPGRRDLRIDDAPPGGRLRLEYTLDGSPEDDEGRTLWTGRLESPLAGQWRLAAVHGDAWWRDAEFRRWAVPIALALAAFYPLPIALLVTLRRRRRLDEARRRFITELAHDLRTPLTSVRLYAEMLESGRASGESRDEYVSVIARESGRLSSLLANLLDLSRLERGARRFETSPVDVREAAETAAHAFASLEPTRAEDLTVDGPDDVLALADPTALGRALANLLENAAKFTPAGTPVRIAWRASEDEVHLRVADEGPGIPAAERGRLFERFARGKRAARDGIPGTGLGLSLVRELIEGSGGSVRHVESGTGATFEIRLRRAPG